MQKLLAITLCLSALLGGCLSPEQPAMVNAGSQQRYLASLASDCESFGFTRGTLEFSQCMLQLDQADTQRRAAIGAAIIGSGMLNPVLVQPVQPIQPVQVPFRPFGR